MRGDWIDYLLPRGTIFYTLVKIDNHEKDRYMAQNEHLDAPVTTEKMPKGVPYILTNEAAERFSF